MRSGCPVSLGLDIFGDRWTLLIVRDLMFSGKRHYREMLASDEHISSNILADRLKMLLAEGIIRKSEDPSHQQKVVYSLTEKGIALLPVLMAISEWSHRYRPVGEAYRPASPPPEPQLPAAWAQEMAKVRAAHLTPDSLAVERPGEHTARS
ncbi:helix-turn-helix domain-containing protein [Deinococcus sp. QL22]|uniref:winged helix-turn-helix transcriptional regulator n=1 Tax=Deinococcus sp. QL22 TaxID=2939437 RepID=UPI002017BB54|nr:helix-turn-helix domain-containing protein [Deinococcus sp. QL22]UQN08738.1 helix-turn-helix transcriptional regulator [Deinococcus sp. QL22]